MWIFDSQHEFLVALFDSLSKQVRSGKLTGVNEDLSKFRSFVNQHFETEEHHMQQMDYKFYDEHKAQHDRFLQDISAIQPEQLNNEIIADWAAWWLCHLPFNDRPDRFNLKSVNWPD